MFKKTQSMLVLAILLFAVQGAGVFADENYWMNIRKAGENWPGYVAKLTEDQLLVLGNQICKDKTGDTAGYGIAVGIMVETPLQERWRKAPPRVSKYLKILTDPTQDNLWRYILMGFLTTQPRVFSVEDCIELSRYLTAMAQNEGMPMILRAKAAGCCINPLIGKILTPAGTTQSAQPLSKQSSEHIVGEVDRTVTLFAHLMLDDTVAPETVAIEIERTFDGLLSYSRQGCPGLPTDSKGVLETRVLPAVTRALRDVGRNEKHPPRVVVIALSSLAESGDKEAISKMQRLVSEDRYAQYRQHIQRYIERATK